jgi:hypothetical protein
VADEKPVAKKPAARKPAATKAVPAKPVPAKAVPAKPAAAKTPVAKPAAAKPATATKPVAVKVPAAKPTAAGTTAGKTTAAKTTAAKTAAANPPAAKASGLKPAAPTPAAKTAPAKPSVTKSAAASTAPVKPVIKKPVAKQPVETSATKPVEKSKEPAPTFSESLAAVAQQSGFAQLKPGETPNTRALLGAIGGVRGIVESILPGIAYLAIYLPTRNLLIAVLVPAFIALLLVVIRAGAKSSMSSAVTGAVLLAITAVLTLITGRAVNNFVPGILINAVGFIVMLGSILARWPLIGLVVGLLFGDVEGWRSDAAKRRILTIATWIWVGLFAVRLAIEVPLYFADNVAALGIVRLITSVPLYAVCLWATWLLVRGVYAGDSALDSSSTDADTK